MKIISLKNVSKFYYSKGVIASGFSKVSLDFTIGEFVAITGESGSGKSTLLNVISGLDTYEEGEMYINGQETSHYSEQDFENYRRKYIGNIFQNFNLVNSYTVYQNIELVLLLNGAKKKDIKKKVLELIKTVNLYKFRNTKVSKLSGGQKQRVAIARALAKDTPIIIADEPTGNLDSKSAKAIMKLLSKIAKDKLVIIVTHNYDQIEEYVTRKIKMHDGKILEDKIIKNIDNNAIYDRVEYKDITKTNKIRLGIRNTFNIIPKFLLILAVYLFVVIALMAEYSSFKQQEYITSISDWNNYFNDTSDKRIIIKKQDKTIINNSDYDSLTKINNIDYIIKNDLLLDTQMSITDYNNFWLYGTVDSIDNFQGQVDIGRLPIDDNEIIVVGSHDDYYLEYQTDNLLKTDLYIENLNDGEIEKNTKLKVVGIKYEDNHNLSFQNKVYLSNKVLDTLKFQINQRYSQLKILFLDTYYENQFNLIPNNQVSDGQAYLHEKWNSDCPNNNCLNQQLTIEVDNLYYKESNKLTIKKIYNNKNIKSLLNIDNSTDNTNNIYISINDYNNLFNKDNYQSSIFVKDEQNIDDTIKTLQNMGYTTLKIQDTLVKDSGSEAIRIFKTIVTLILVITLFFISYFVIKIILKSRQIYFSTIRMLGATRKVSKELLIIELLNVASLAYFSFLIIIYLNYLKIINIGFINIIIKYLSVQDYILIYLIITLMSLLISIKFSKNLFKNSTMKTMKEEV